MISQGDIMSDVILVIYAILFSITSAFFGIYFRQLRKITLEYIRSKKVFEDIIFSLNKDLQKCEEKVMDLIRAYQERAVEGNRGKEEINALFADVREKLDDLIKYREKISVEIEDLRRKIEDLYAKYSDILRKISEMEVTGVKRAEHDVTRTAVTSKHISETGVLTSLTNTEIRVLEILAMEGEKTVPEIRDRIGLTREHTARLLKSLYERGYLERRSDKIPFVYRLNKEVEEILKSKK